LRLKGYRLLRRNWRTRYGEIDLIARRGETLVFVEVKARWSKNKGLPEDSLTPEKKNRLLRLAEMYLSRHPHQGPVRLDVIAIDFCSEKPQIRHYEGAIHAEET